jgi:hypothetical protein
MNGHENSSAESNTTSVPKYKTFWEFKKVLYLGTEYVDSYPGNDR